MADITGIRRGLAYSPNHEDDDLGILLRTAEELQGHGYSVTLVDEGEVGTVAFGSEVIFNMCQGLAANTKLLELEATGALLINSPTGALNCLRQNLFPRLEQAGIPIPPTVEVPTNGQAALPAPSSRLWVKRGDVHAQSPHDVVAVESAREVRETLDGFHARGIASAVLQEHVAGPVVKFYALRGGSFFRWYSMTGGTDVRIDEDRMFQLAEASAAAIGLDVYGGECVIAPDGRLVVIDLNDWPSFARFRDAAAASIADYIVRMAKLLGKL